jgi:hypothetical protein
MKYGQGSKVHEKIDPRLAQRIKAVLWNPSNDEEFEQLHAAEQSTAWFGKWVVIAFSFETTLKGSFTGVHRKGEKSSELLLRDYGRYADLLWNSNAPESMPRTTTHPLENTVDTRTSYPSLVSFVGQTGAGKSTIIKLLIRQKISQEFENFASTPIVGMAGLNLPTSSDIHLYSDPRTTQTTIPILYADCEGLDGGEREPQAAQFQSKRDSDVDCQSESQTFVERKICWADSGERQSREFACSHLYPRILFAFSDVVVFVHQNSRLIQSWKWMPQLLTF